jgi:ribosomal-protein-alanine N-acetyltransferase
MIVAITPRLLLRHWQLTDAGAASHIYGDAIAMRYFGDGSTFSPAELAASFPPLIADYTTFGYGNYAVVERTTNRILGHCGARYIRRHARVEADWAIDRQFWKRGYAIEAAQAAFARSFFVDGVPRIVGIAHRDNAASIAVMRRLGMQFAEDVTAHGFPSVLYAIEREAFWLPPEILGAISFPPRGLAGR